MLYEALNTSVLNHLPKKTNYVLDIGCGTGQLGKYIKQKFECQVVGLTYSKEEVEKASLFLDEVIVCDLNNISVLDLGRFDCVICSHVLEHLYQPENLLKQLLNVLLPNGQLVVALPNVLHWKQRLKFLKGNF